MEKLNAAIRVHTLGTESNSAIVEIGVVLFDETALYKHNIVVNLEQQTGRSIDMRTLRWWMSRSDHERAVFDHNGVSLHEAVAQLRQLLAQACSFVVLERMDIAVLMNVDPDVFEGLPALVFLDDILQTENGSREWHDRQYAEAGYATAVNEAAADAATLIRVWKTSTDDVRRRA